ESVGSLFRSFRPQTPDRVGQRCPDRDIAHGQQRDGDRAPAGDGKNGPIVDPGAIGVIVQPIVHDPPRDGEGDETGEQDQFNEVEGQQASQERNRGAQHLADADLLCPSFGRITREPEEAETGNKDREGGEDGGKAARQGFRLELILEVLVQEFVLEGVAGVARFDDIPGGRDGFRNVGVRLQAHAEDTGVRRIAKDDQWRGALVHVVVDKVFYDPDDAVFFLAVIARDQAADNAVPADDMREAFVDDDAVAVLRGDLMKVPPRRKLHAHRGDVFGGGALDRDEDLFVRVFAGPLEIAGIAVQGQHGTAAQRRVLYVPGVDEVVANGFEMFAHLALEL